MQNKVITLLIFYIIFFVNNILACNHSSGTLVSETDNGNGTFTYVLNVCLELSDGVGPPNEFTINFSGAGFTSFVSSSPASLNNSGTIYNKTVVGSLIKYKTTDPYPNSTPNTWCNNITITTNGRPASIVINTSDRYVSPACDHTITISSCTPPTTPTITSVAPTCVAAGTSTISNYSASNTYTFTPAGPTVGAGGVISGMTTGTSYTVKASSGGCSSTASSSFSNAAQLSTPATPTITNVAATCLAAGTSTVSNYNAAYTYTFTPAGPTVGAGGAISGMTTGTSYTVKATSGSCTSGSSSSFSNAAQLVAPVTPTITNVAATCLAAGTSTVSNYNAAYTYTFTPAGPTVGAGGTISGMTTGTSYTVKAASGGCSSPSSSSFSNAAQLVAPVAPTITNVAATCLAAGTSTVSNYNAAYTYTFSPTGPTVGAGGAISGMTTGTSYTVTATSGGCTSPASSSFSNAAQLIAPVTPTITSVAATCSAAGTSTISNYNAAYTYTFTPAGPSAGAGGTISGMTLGTSYTVKATSGGCSSASSSSFSNGAQLASVPQPTINTVAATCNSAGTSTISNYNAGFTYTFNPLGPTAGVGGAIVGMVIGTSYTVIATSGGCTSLASGSFSNAAQLTSPAVPTISSVAATCSAAGTSTVSNYNAAHTYTFSPLGPSVGVGGAIAGMTLGTSYTVTATLGSCTSVASATFSNGAQLASVPQPTINSVAATCNSAGTSTISNYNAGFTYTFNPLGPTAGAGGAISGMVIGTSYTVIATSGGCTSPASGSFSNAAQLASPAVPTISSVAATCNAAGTSTVSNYNAAHTYTFSPLGPTVGVGGAIAGMTLGTSYTVTATLGSCTSVASATFSNAAQLASVPQPTINSVAATCLAAGSSTISNYNAAYTYTFTPAGPSAGAGGSISGMALGTSYTVVATSAGCSSIASSSFSDAAQLASVPQPTINNVAASCSAAGTSTVSNYNAGFTYTFTPLGPSVGAGGTISGMVLGTSYTVVASSGSCNSIASSSFSNTAQLVTPAVPTISIVSATCLASGTSSISNYNAANTYTFTPSGPSVGVAGALSGMVLGTSYTVTASNGSCTSAPTTSFSNGAQLSVPTTPTITSVAATCSAAGTSTISNYNATLNYTFTPSGPTVGGGGVISGMVLGTSYTVIADNGSCSSSSSASFSNAAQLAAVPQPTITTSQATCLAAGSSTVSNYNAVYTYTFSPTGPTIGAGGVIAGMNTGTSYTLVADNGSCNSLISSSFSNTAQLSTPVTPLLNGVAATCSAAGTSTLANYNALYTYVFTPNGPTVGGGGVISGMIIGTSYTVVADNGSCTSSASLSFSNSAQLTIPSTPIISTSPATCLVSGSSLVSNFNNLHTYDFSPVGPLVTAGGNITGMFDGVSYTLTATSGGCTSVPSSAFSNSAQLVVPASPIISTIAPTCSTSGSSSITNYSSTNSYTFSPTGPSITVNGGLQGLSPTNYTITVTNPQGCTNTANFVIVAAPLVPTIAATKIDPVLCGGMGTINLTTTNVPNGSYTISYVQNGVTKTFNNVFIASNSAAINNVLAGTYSDLTITANTCVSSLGQSVSLIDPLPPTLTITNPVAVCAPNTIDLSSPAVTLGSSNGSQFTYWSDANATQGLLSPVVSSSNTYYIKASLKNCTTVKSVNVVINQVDVIAITPVNDLCTNDNPINLSATPIGGVWSGNGVSAGVFNPANATIGKNTITYTSSGICPTSATVDILVNATPNLNFVTDKDSVCIGEPFLLQDASDLQIVNFIWDYSNGVIVNSITKNISHTYNDAGKYTITMTGTSITGCTSTITKLDFITVLAKPHASFLHLPTGPTVLSPIVDFTNNSTDATNYEWNFNDGKKSYSTNVSHTYPATPETYFVRLTAYNGLKTCNDDTLVPIEIFDDIYYYVPNTFTPNGDELNNIFIPVLSGAITYENYSFYIFNRWGELLFESHNKDVGWDGTYNNKICKPDTYIWKLEFKDQPTLQKHFFTGHINLVN